MQTKYNTQHRNHFLEAAQLFKEPFTAKDIEDSLRNSGNPMGLSTIYRLLNDYSTDGSLRKLVDKDGVVKYFYFKPCHHNDHFYLECEKCHQLTHVDCHHLRGFAKHLAKKHSFEISNYNLIVSGICTSCMEKTK